MIQEFTIDNEILQVDTAKTQDFYLTQHKIVDSCQCDDCNFYATSFISNDLEVFSILQTMGIDLSKNLDTELTGVWCIRDENGELTYCEQVYQVVGRFLTGDGFMAFYEKTENTLKVKATIIKFDDERLNIELVIDNLRI